MSPSDGAVLRCRDAAAILGGVRTAVAERRLGAFRKILALEADSGYRNRAVTGGLDRFLERLKADPLSSASLHGLVAHGLFSVAYRDLPIDRREKWVREAERLLGPEASKDGRRSRQSRIGPDSPVAALQSVGRSVTSRLARLQVHTIRDLLYLFPHRHRDYSQRCPVAKLRLGEEQTILVTLWEAYEVRLGPQRRLRATEAVVGDETGNIRVVWFNMPYLAVTLKSALLRAQSTPTGSVRLMLSGKASAFRGRIRLENPDWELVDDEDDLKDLVHTGRLVPVYPATEGLSQRSLRRVVRQALTLVLHNSDHPRIVELEDPLPVELRFQHGLVSLAESLAQLHYPDSREAYDAARRRMAFEELLVLQLAIISRRAGQPTGPGVPLPARPEVVRSFLTSLPFELTAGQNQALKECLEDIRIGTRPMSRLLQGDVGSGKTVVALALLLTAVANGYQGVLMAPTEVLAEQHYLTVTRLLSGLPQPSYDADWLSASIDGIDRPVRVGLLRGSTQAAARRTLYQWAAEGALDILVGTHALLHEGVEVPNLALAVVDEQHRFGVLQRAALRGKGQQPHLLAMSATPIPRTLALTIYGDLRISTIPELPAGRQAVVTRLLGPERREHAERFVVEQVERGRQAFVVCPLIDESEAIQARAATEEIQRLRAGTFRRLRSGLLHGRMTLREKRQVMERFRSGDLDVLVSTPVIEVGIDVPNATVMLIEGADRFGLSQLHQLRGRVGRGAHRGYCLLVAESPSQEGQARLKALVGSNDGFEIAEADLRLRGPGDFFGTRQSGLPTLRAAQLSDRDLLTSARAEAQRLVPEGSLDSLAGTPLGDAVQRYDSKVVDEMG